MEFSNLSTWALRKADGLTERPTDTHTDRQTVSNSRESAIETEVNFVQGGAEADRDDAVSSLQATLGGAGGTDFFPYVSYRIMIDFAETATHKY